MTAVHRLDGTPFVISGEMDVFHHPGDVAVSEEFFHREHLDTAFQSLPLKSGETHSPQRIFGSSMVEACVNEKRDDASALKLTYFLESCILSMMG